MNPIGLIELRASAHPFQKKRNQQCVIRAGQFDENVFKLLLILLAHVGWHLHSGDDDLGVRIFGSGAIDDSLKIRSGGGGHDPAESVIPAEFQHEHIHPLPQEPLNAAKPARRRVPAQPGINHREVPLPLIDFLLQQSRKTFRRFQPVPGGQAVPQHHDRSFRVRGHGVRGFCAPGGWDCARQQEEAKAQPQYQGDRISVTAHRRDSRTSESNLQHVFYFRAQTPLSCALLAQRYSAIFAFDPSGDWWKVRRMTDQPILQIRGLTKSYATEAGPLTVLKDVSFDLPAGSTCSIVGPSGSGKTTLLGLSAGLDQPTSGTVQLAGNDLHSLGEDERARVRGAVVGFVFQNFQLIPTLTALENVMIPLELQGSRDARPRGRELLAKVGLAERCDHYPAQLSGGEQQRVAMARAFMNRPKILFADEPTGNLDAETADAVVEALFELNASFQTALVLVTHNLELAQRTQRIFKLHRGMLVAQEAGRGHRVETTPVIAHS
jgi:putative ABC transport system ATP-binding protein